MNNVLFSYTTVAILSPLIAFVSAILVNGAIIPQFRNEFIFYVQKHLDK